MKFNLRFMTHNFVRTPVIAGIVGLAVMTASSGGAASADPAQDAVAKINELSRKAEELTATMNNLDKKLRLLKEADTRHSEDLAALNAAKAQLAAYQGSVDKFAASVYMGGRSDGLNAMLTAESPKKLLDKLSIQRVMATEMSQELQRFRGLHREAQAIEAASARSAAEARAAADEAVAVRANLQSMQSEMRIQLASLRANYGTLNPTQQAMLAPASQALAALGPAAPIPTVGMSGLVPNARFLAQYIMATYPGVQSIGGVRADPLPDHPSGRAIDIMIGSNMALGDAIQADIQSQAARFGVSYTLWRVASHFDHVHVTVN